MKNFIRKLAFHYTKLDKRHALKESQRISEWRYKYLQQIKRFRDENRSIVNLEETWYYSLDTVNKGWVDQSNNCFLNVPASRGCRIIILHAGSTEGWIDNCLYSSAKNIKDAKVDYHDQMTGEVFYTWFSYNLLPNLPPNSVIVMDNASYHSVQE